MKITITAAFGRVQVEVPAAAAERLMLDAVRTAYLEGLEEPSPREELEEAWRDALGIGENGVSNTGNRLESTPLWGPGEAKQAESAEGDDTPGNESGG